MPRYMTLAKYSAAGSAAVFKEGYGKRRQALEGLISGLGGDVAEMTPLAEDEWDFLAIYTLPDDGTAPAKQAARALMGSGTGGFERVQTFTLLDPDAFDAIRQSMPGYKGPGQ